MIRHGWLAVLWCLICFAIPAGATWHGEDVSATIPWRFSMCDNCPPLGTAQHGRAFAYNQQYADTAGVGIRLTPSAGPLWNLVANWGTYDIWYYSSAGRTRMVDNYPMVGPIIPPSALSTDSVYVVNVIAADSCYIAGELTCRGGTIIKVGTTRWDKSNSDLIDATAIDAAITRDSEWSQWRQHPNLPAGHILVGGGTAHPTDRAMSGDATIDSLGAVALVSGITRDSEWDTWREHPNLTAGHVLVGGGTSHPTNRAMSGEATIDSLGSVTLSAGITRDTEWDTWREHPNLTAGNVLVGGGTAHPTSRALSGDGTLDSLGVLTLIAGITRDAEWTQWRQHPSLTAGHILIGNASGRPTDRAISGEMTIDSLGATTAAATLTRDAEWAAWRQHPNLAAGHILVGGGTAHPTDRAMTGEVGIDSLGATTVAAGMTRDNEWDTVAEINAATTDYDVKKLTTPILITLFPEYPGALLDTLKAYGASNKGNMASLEDSVSTTLRYPAYEWTSSEATSQHYVIKVNVQLPSDFSAFVSATADSAVTIYYKTGLAATTNNAVEADVYEDGAATIRFDGGELAGTSWTTLKIGSHIIGTGWAADDRMRIWLKMKANATSGAAAWLGRIEIRYIPL